MKFPKEIFQKILLYSYSMKFKMIENLFIIVSLI